MTTNTISNYDDMINSRDVLDRIEELETIAEMQGGLDDDETAEHAALVAFASEGEGFADWWHGETFIRDSYFEDYARELAEDIGAIGKDADWPNYCIDWERAARDLQMDYSSVEFEGVTYWARS